jgi:hypothetical protein
MRACKSFRSSGITITRAGRSGVEPLSHGVIALNPRTVALMSFDLSLDSES